MLNGLNILNYYLEQNKNKDYVKEYQSTSVKASGKTFAYVNTNFRYMISFVDTFQNFVKYDNKDRSTWDVYANKEQKAKHWTVRMQQSKLFKLNKGNYSLTEKGKAFADFVNIYNDPKCYISKEEAFIIIYNFILNSYFSLKPNYVIKRTLEVFDNFKNDGLTPSYILNSFKELLKADDLDKRDLFKYDAFWLLTFAKDKNFITLYKSSTPDEKEALYNHVIDMSKGSRDKVKKNNDLISWKYVSKGQYDVHMFLDEVITLYLTYLLLDKNNMDSLSLVDNICSIISDIYSIDSKKIKYFVEMHKDVFDVIYNEAILNKNIDTEINNDEDYRQEDLDDSLEPTFEKTDDTTIKNNHKLRKTSQILKRITKERVNYRCELDAINSCRYFTSKVDNNNYLEIHHLIPFEFSNEFESSIEILDNYVALCPYCHRLLHFGVNSERKKVLKYLYKQRNKALKNKNINITLKRLMAYYGIE